MEKFTVGTKNIRIGLLGVILILFSPVIFAQTLEAVPLNRTVFVNQETQFTLKIPNANSSDVQIVFPNFPEGVVFNSSRKENYVLQNERGVQIELFFTFQNAGVFDLPPLAVYIQGRGYSANFKSVYVSRDPKTIVPKILIKFDGGLSLYENGLTSQRISLVAGKPYRFVVYLFDGAGVQNFSYEIPKNSIFKELERFELPPPSKEFSSALSPIAKFEWVALEEGETTLPEIKIVATSYDGNATLVLMPECVVEVIPANESVATRNAFLQDTLFENAFEQEEAAEEIAAAAPDISTLVQNAELRLQKERSLFVFAAAAFGVLVFAAMILFFFRKKMFAAIFASIALLFAFFVLLPLRKVFDRCGIVTGGFVQPVPEDSALTKSEAVVGSRVLIRQEIDSWYYIEYNESGGWIKKENVVLIK